MTRLTTAVILGLALAACRALPPETVAEPIPAWTPPPGAEAWPVDSEVSRIIIRVGRAGPLAQLGHEHVIVGPLDGTLSNGEGPEGSGFRVHLSAQDLVVDPADARATAGLDGELSDAARSGTRENMLGEGVLDAGRHPDIIIRSRSIERSGDGLVVRAEVILRGRLRPVRFPARIRMADDEVRVRAEFSLTHAELGLQPFSTLGGSLRVAEEIGITVDLTARPPR